MYYIELNVMWGLQSMGFPKLHVVHLIPGFYTTGAHKKMLIR